MEKYIPGMQTIDEKYGNSAQEAVFGDAHAKCFETRFCCAIFTTLNAVNGSRLSARTEKLLECDSGTDKYHRTRAPEAVVLQRLTKAFLRLEAVKPHVRKLWIHSGRTSRQSWIAKVKKFIKKSPEGDQATVVPKTKNLVKR